ncbi:hypothetical protein [Heyndrickxia coagulans]|uniref:hypothetical protein n=1 Tax=Heyndrickxia coagulans TaxID=1398 RepID=UPI0002D9F15C|nr:hypothetical protein [Heyndrickxia coagulans]MCR2845569.1 hypothetical protein [Heyndrickxia coagulans]
MKALHFAGRFPEQAVLFFSALYVWKQERALMAVRGPVRTGRASGLDRKDFSGAGTGSVLRGSGHPPAEKNRKHIF